MKPTNIKWLSRCLIASLAFVSFSSCSDDHFDINSTNASGTLWENLLAPQKCDSFAMILQKTIVNKKDYGIPSTLTYDNLLKSTKVLTVWAPQDGSYNAAHWLNLLEQGDNETVETQFVANHIAYFNYNGSYPVVKKILLANSKFATYDDAAATNTFNSVPILNDPAYKNIASTNGTLHVLDGASSFYYNLREILSVYPELSDLYKYVESRDTLVFLPGASTPGTTVNGEIHYVDSVFLEYNKVYPIISTNEDSLSAAILPGNEAWAEALAKVSQSFNYKDNYYYFDYNRSTTTPQVDSIKSDSVREARTVNAIFNNMFYSLNEQPAFDVTTASPTTVANFFATSDSLVSTAYYHRNYLYHQHAPECNEIAEGKTPYEASNGYAFITDHFNFKANKSWQFDIYFDAEDSRYYDAENSKNIGSYANHQVTPGTRNDSVKGTVRGNYYREFVPSAPSSKEQITYKIPDVMSGTYDIYAVIVPENIIDPSMTTARYNMFTATLAYDFLPNGRPVTFANTKEMHSDPTKVDTILLFENFKFPYAYAGLPNAKPYITLNSTYTRSKRLVATPYFYIDCFILKSKDE